MRTIARSSSNRKSASALASSVLPTPVGPRNRNEPVGRSGSEMPARARRTASDTARTASRCPTRRAARPSSIRSSLAVSPSSSRPAGMPVHDATTSATSSGPTCSLTMASRASIDARASASSLLGGRDLRVEQPAYACRGRRRAGPARPGRAAGRGSAFSSPTRSSVRPFSCSHRALSAASCSLPVGEVGAEPLEALARRRRRTRRARRSPPSSAGRPARCSRRSRPAGSRSPCAAGTRLRRPGRSPCRAGSER